MISCQNIIDSLHLYGCRKSRIFLASQPDLRSAWENCPCGSWMLEAMEKAGMEPKRLYTVLLDTIAPIVMPILTQWQMSASIKALQTRRAWCAGQATDEELEVARAAARAAGWAAEAAADADAAAEPETRAEQAAREATAADEAARAVMWAAEAARVAAGVAADAEKMMADTIRQHIAFEEVEKLLTAREEDRQ